ncbi:MAG TPA: substrate-binding domain-containing protein [Reyranella sp.]|jgi:molybdate transport system substrate-binding protein
MIRLLRAFALMGSLLLLAFPAAAENLKVLTGGAFKPVLIDMLPQFEKQTGHKVTVENDTAGALTRRIMAGEAFDIVILPLANLDQLSAEGKVIDDSMTPFGKVGVGVAVALSAPQPNIGSTEGLRRTLLDARTVAYIDPAMGGTSGIYVARLFQQLGIASQMQAKSVLVHDGLAGQAVARGQAEIALQQASELRLVPGVKFAGLLPEAIQNWTVYTGALSPAARSKDAALALMSALSDPGMEPMLKRRGLDTP